MKQNAKLIKRNKYANFNFFIFKEYLCGLILEGIEVKAFREGRVKIENSYVKVLDGEVYLINAITDNAQSRNIKLLLKKSQIREIANHLKQKGNVVIPLSILLSHNLIKIEVGAGRGKKKYDKHKSIIDKENIKYARNFVGKMPF